MTTQDITALAGALQQNARNTDDHGLSAEAVQQLSAAGLLGAATPTEVMERARQIALGCGASSWMVTQFATAASILALAPSDIQQKIGGAGVLHIGRMDVATLTLNDGQVFLSGSLSATGGLDHADWLLISDLDHDEQKVFGLIRKSELKLSGYPYRGGLRGLNWQAVEATQVPVDLIPVDKAISYHWDESVVLLGAVIGAAQAGYNDYVATTRARITGIGGQAVAQFTQVQARLAESHAELKGLQALYDTVLDRVDQQEAEHPECVRDRVYIARKGVEAVNRLLSQMGAMGLSETNPVQRRYRDLRALACVRGLDWIEQMPVFGKHELGLIEAAF
ncbi:acyl-CoA dehydrogenase family protein [Brevundimonas vesicularis]|uniref:acyl-CoA dehydrogenase family protein n=1 Tax=Brevundimonas vesicularis TaxID=41276 RepID=UPI0038D3E958